MFGTKIDAANTRIAGLTALLAVAGLTVAADAALPTPEAFKATLAAAQKKAVDEALASVNTALATSTATASAYASGLAAAGVKVGDFKAEDFKTADGAKAGDLNAAATSVKTAVGNALAAQSARQIAATGHEAALDVAPSGTNPGTTDVAPETSADFLAKLNAITDGGARTAYLRKHKAKFPVK